ncbi:MAG TPA: UDP-N-acetylmuramoyl-L-alanine--D-glutamate ligase [Candidatus Dormibacteraeota bacterium]|nr:UDP-N-acetylmuramoyl-L-alanine--D-glutamate ligase [Candidatus Dormibacteraeota bacterium]
MTPEMTPGMKPGIELAGKRVLVVGLARTGVATALFCAARGARVTATEERPELQMAETAAKLRAAGVTLELGGHGAKTFVEQDLIVPSPGVPPSMTALAGARAAGIPVWSEIELAWRFLRGRLVCITGSNGKTTTTSLIGHILETAGLPVQIAGNIGTPLISRVDVSSDSGYTVVEASSFQLESIAAFRPDVAVLLNITPDHLDRHGSLEAYAGAKARIFENQGEEDAAIVNADDEAASQYAPSRPRLFWFSRKKRVLSGCFLRGDENDEIVFRSDGMETVLLHRSDIGLRGEHNVENVLAAAAAARLVGVAPAAIAAAVRSFAGVEHRIEYVDTISGVEYFNDSKATNVDATVKALDAFPGNVLLILGGKDKGSDYAILRDALRRHARMVLLIGSAAEKIEAQLGGVVPAERAGTMARAVEIAAQRAQLGDTVLLAPACASFDQFESYEHRGRVFKQLVRELAQKHAAREPARKV